MVLVDQEIAPGVMKLRYSEALPENRGTGAVGRQD